MTDHVVGGSTRTPDADLMDLAARVFDMARGGDAASLAAYLDAGVPVNLTNTNGDTLVMLASYYGHEAAVAALIARGADVNRGSVFKNDTAITQRLLAADADPLYGSPCALETARYFGREELERRLQQRLARGRSGNT